MKPNSIACACLISLLCTSLQALEVIDFSGHTITLEQPAKRIVALAPHIVENLYSAGAGNTLVGAVDYCDYPQAAQQVTRVGSISSHSLEAILALKPDLVIGWDSGHGAQSIKKLAQFGIQVYHSNPLKLEDVAKAIRDYGILTGNKKFAQRQATSYLKRLAQLKQQYQEKTKISTLYQVWNTPLQTLNDSHIISDVIHLCGGTNAFGDLPAIAPKISIESVIARNPQVIIASGMGEQRPDWLDTWKQWPTLTAVKHNNLYFIPPDIIQRHTARILTGATMMCEHLETAREKLAR